MKQTTLAKIDADLEHDILSDLVDTKLSALWQELDVLTRQINLPVDEKAGLLKWRFFVFAAEIASETELTLGEFLQELKLAYIEVEESLEIEEEEEGDARDNAIEVVLDKSAVKPALTVLDGGDGKEVPDFLWGLWNNVERHWIVRTDGQRPRLFDTEAEAQVWAATDTNLQPRKFFKGQDTKAFPRSEPPKTVVREP